MEFKRSDIEHQVCSVAMARKLYELGVPQLSSFYWINPKYTMENRHELIRYEDTFIKEPYLVFYFSAFTSIELGHILPSTIEKKNISSSEDSSPYTLMSHKTDHGWFVYYQDISYKIGFCHVHDNEAEARAIILCELIETGHIKNE